MSLKNGFFILTLVLAGCSGVFAGPVYNQPASFPPGSACPCWTSSTVNSQNSGFQVFDNFQLSSPANINFVTWQGLYWDFSSPGNNPVGPDTTTWDIEFWSNNAGLPGSLLYSAALTAASVNTTLLGTVHELGSPADPTNVYGFRALLPVSFSASAGTTYWFSVLSVQANIDPLFSWTLGSGGDGITQQENLATSGFTQQPGDRAFSLNSVPEPGTLAVAAIGLATLAFLKRRTT